jgi:phosphoribosylformylglycinamidine synthase
VLILHANGTNRDGEAALACRLAGGDPEIVHVNQLRRGERALLNYQMLVLPGGFSYGDDLGAGRLWALDLEHRLGAMIHRFVDDGRPVLGICNGFQALVKAGLLPGGNGGGAARRLTLTHNASARFECRWVTLEPHPDSRSLFTAGLREPIYCPVAHGEGRLVAEDGATAAHLQRAGLIALTYSAGSAAEMVPYPANPNGSVLAIAGISNAAGNVLGLMPHPEDHIFSWQHPQRHRGASGGRGLVLFANGLKHC